jgi:peptidoglycan/LPS O-acetylase OafA/YrhL
LRAFAALSVLVYHLSQVYLTVDQPLYGALAFYLKPLQLGVTVFFVLPASCSTARLPAPSSDPGEFPDVGRYLRSRVLRILPA